MSDNYVAAVKTPKGELQFDYESMANRPNKFVNINVCGENIVPLEENDTLTFTSDENIILTPDVENKKINIDVNNEPLAVAIRDMIEPTLINDKTKEIYGMTSSADINDIFTFFRDTITRHVLEVTVTTYGGIPIEGAVISGLEQDIITDEKGRALYRVIAGATKVTLTVTVPEKYQDVVRTKTVDHLPTDAFHQFCEIRMDRSNSIVISKSTTLTFSPEVAELSISCAGGGGGGGGGASSTWTEGAYWYQSGGAGGGGGGGGFVTNETVSLEEKENIVHITVGAGGAGGKGVSYSHDHDDKDDYRKFGYAESGKDGGESYVTLNDVKYAVASGGRGGTGGYADTGHTNGGRGGTGGDGNGVGGTGSAYELTERTNISTGEPYWGESYNEPNKGGDATASLESTGTKVGGGGSGGAGNDKLTQDGGAPYGGAIIKIEHEDYYTTQSQSGRGYAGGGAGGLGGGTYSGYAGASGYSGVVGIKWKFRDEIKEEEQEKPAE